MRVLLLTFGFLFGLSLAHADPVDLEKGQVWTFKDAPTDNARIIIGDIEDLWEGKETAVSISVIGLDQKRLPNGQMGGDQIFHLPFARSELEPHLIELADKHIDPPDGYVEGYSMWKAAVEAEEAGVFTISPAEVIDFVTEITLGAQ